jgi:CelD/BcsL family acetyltransferase involved in cellulose biosynthesis
MVTARVVASDAEWDDLRHDWNELYSVSPTASPPLDYAWLRGWWKAYGPTLRDSRLRIATVWHGAELIAAAPLYVRGGAGHALGLRRLGFISTGEAEFEETCPDYLDMLCRPGAETSGARLIWQAIGRMAWDQLELVDLPEGSPLLRASVGPTDARNFPRGVCPIADLTGGFDAYLGRLSSNSRQHARRLLRAARRDKAVFELARETDQDQFFDDLVLLHQVRWSADGKPGCFAAPRFTEFHRELVREWLPQGRSILARLSHEGQVYAVLYGFVHGTRFDFYQSGIRLGDKGPFDSPGNTAHLLLMEALAGRGITAYDFLRGSSSYKERLATRHASLVGIRIWRPTIRAASHRSLQFAGRIAGKGRSILKGRPR